MYSITLNYSERHLLENVFKAENISPKYLIILGAKNQLFATYMFDFMGLRTVQRMISLYPMYRHNHALGDKGFALANHLYKKIDPSNNVMTA